MTFVEFYAPDLAGALSPAVGDRSVIVLDGRERSASHHAIARREAVKRGYAAYRIAKGTFSEPRYLCALQQQP